MPRSRMMVSLDIKLGGVILHMIIVMHKVIWIMLIFDDHVMKYNTCLHSYTQLSFVHVSIKATDDGETRL